MRPLSRIEGGLLRLTMVATTLALLAGCSLLTSWDGLTTEGPMDASPDVSADGSDGGLDGGDAGRLCVTGGYYCGGDKVSGDSDTLYRCENDGSATRVFACAHGCEWRQGKDDACACVEGSSYCGNDQVVGDPRTLYRCEADHSATLLTKCPNGCTINAGTNDSCF